MRFEEAVELFGVEAVGRGEGGDAGGDDVVDLVGEGEGLGDQGGEVDFGDEAAVWG